MLQKPRIKLRPCALDDLDPLGIGMLGIQQNVRCIWEDCRRNLLIAAFGFVFLTSLPTAIRDRRFFLKYWGLASRDCAAVSHSNAFQHVEKSG